MTLFPAPVMVKLLLAKADGAKHNSATATTPHHFWVNLIIFLPTFFKAWGTSFYLGGITGYQ
jgi:hypothetical protein